MRRLYYCGVLILLCRVLAQAQTFTLSISDPEVDCTAVEVCYQVSLSSSEVFDLGSYNLRLLYDCSAVDYINSSANVDLLPLTYSITNESDLCLDASGLGSLPFEQTLAYLQISIDYNQSNPVGINQTETVILQNFCFDILNEDILTDPDLCFDLFWVTEANREGYVNSVTILNSSEGELDLLSSTYISLTENNNCFPTDCVEAGPCVPIIDADGDGVCDVGNDPDPDPLDPCVPNITDDDGDGVCDVGQNADPDPMNPCIPNLVDADGDGVCDLTDDPDPNDPCNPDLSAPSCINPTVTFELAFTDPRVDCTSATICYDININAGDDSFELGDYNLKIFYDGDVLDAAEQSPSVPLSQSDYVIFSINDVQLGDQTGNGSLAFEDNLSILDISTSFIGPDPSTINSSNTTVIEQICFSVLDQRLLSDPLSCIDLVWVTDASKENYTTGTTSINIESAFGVTADLTASTYTSTNNCFEFACLDDECEVLACNSVVHVSLDTCLLKVDADVFLEGADNAPYVIDFYTLESDYVRQDTLVGSDSGETYLYKVSCLENSCWGQVKIELNVLPKIEAPCQCTSTDSIPEDCLISCGFGRLPEALLSVREVDSLTNLCGPEIISQIRIRDIITDTLCQNDIEIHERTYFATILQHGEKDTIELLCQRYGIEKIPLEGHAFDIQFRFPDDLTLQCAMQTREELSPDSVLAKSLVLTNSFPYILDTERPKTIESIVELERIQVPNGILVQREKLVSADADGDGVLEWILIREAMPLFRDSIVYDTLDLFDGFEEILIPDKLCNVVVSYTDTEFFTCGDSRKTFRLWNIYDWCNSQIKQSSSQLIELVDTQSPSLLLEIDGKELPVKFINDVQSYIEPWSCSGEYKLPELNIVDNCDNQIDVVWTSSEGTIQDGFVTNIPKNNVPVEVKANLYDDCLNESVIFFNVSVLDTIKPVASCLERLTVSLTTDANQLNGTAQIYAEDLSGGSNDAGCDSLTYSVLSFSPQPNTPLRQGTEFVSFSCSDLGRDITVALVVQDEARNRSTCDVNIAIINEFKPQIECEDIVIDCGDDRISRPLIIGDFCNDFLRSLILTESSFRNECRQNGMIREWYLDLNGDESFSEDEPYCQQTVSFTEESTFEATSIKWPKHYDGSVRAGKGLECRDNGEPDFIDVERISLGDDLNCLDDLAAFSQPTWCNSACGLVAASVLVDTIQISGFCIKYINQWTVIDWCTYESNGDGTDDDDDSFMVIEDWAQGNCASCDNGFGPEISDSIYFMLDQFDEDGFYTFDQLITITNTQAPEITIPDTLFVSLNSNCQAQMLVQAAASENCGNKVFESSRLKWAYKVYSDSLVVLSGTDTRATFDVEFLLDAGLSNHYMEWSVVDGCGNQSLATTIILIEKTQVPSAICFAAISSSTVIDGSGMVWATDFDLSSVDNCTSPDELLFSIVADGEVPLTPQDEEFHEQSAISIVCDSLIDELAFDVWVWDTFSNGSKCDVKIRIDHTCLSDSLYAEVSGQVKAMSGASISDVNITMHMLDNSTSQLTNSFGEYAFAQVDMFQGVEIHAHKEDGTSEGLSTLDLLLIQQHILGLQTFDSAYKILAADLNEDQQLSASDLVTLRREILSFDGSTEWRFFDAQATFSDTNSPWSVNQYISLKTNETSMDVNDFIGLKLGDVNGSAIDRAESRSQESILRIPNRVIKANEIVGIPIQLTSVEAITAFQLGLEFDRLEFIDISSDLDGFSKSNIGHTNEELKISWANPLSPIESTTIMLTVKAMASEVRLDQAIRLMDKFNSESYTAEATISPIILESVEDPIDEFKCSQNYPNPFIEESVISVRIPRAGQLTMTVFSVSGQVEFEDVFDINQGSHKIELKASRFNSSGLYFYSLEWQNEKIVKSLILLDN